MDDSGNSESFQSSTWDEEFDSDANYAIPVHSNQPPPLQPYDHHFPNYFENPMSLQNYPTSHMNPDVNLDCSKNLNSKNNSTYHVNPMLASLLATQQKQPLLLPPENTTDTQPQAITQVAKNLRKRPRPPREAATTVLTTDIANFRAMVQEFTGIREPPFSYSPFQRSRPNILGTGSNPPPYLTRPFPQKVELTSSSYSSSAILNTNMNLGANINNYQFPPLTTSSLYNHIPNPCVASYLDSYDVNSSLVKKSHQDTQDF